MNLGHLREVLKAEDELLDVGCYHGHLYDYLGHEKYTGIDLFQDHIDKARELHRGSSSSKGTCSVFRVVGM